MRKTIVAAIGTMMVLASFAGFAWAGHETDTNTWFGLTGTHSSLTGSYNSFFGQYAGYNNSAGSQNTFLGSNAGQNNMTGSQNTIAGGDAGTRNSAGSGNVFLGYGAGNDELGSNMLYIDNCNLYVTDKHILFMLLRSSSIRA